MRTAEFIWNDGIMEWWNYGMMVTAVAMSAIEKCLWKGIEIEYTSLCVYKYVFVCVCIYV